MKALLGLTLLLAVFEGTYSGDAKTASYCSLDATASVVLTPPGYVSCTCKSGFCGNGTSCYPFAAASTNKCCVPGSTTWNFDTHTCDDVNECTNDALNMCVPKTSCTNVRTNYLCSSSRALNCSGGQPCGPNTDCVEKSGTYSCADPCDSDNHQTIDGSTRLSSVNSTGVFQSDRYVNGWHRYTGSMGVQMKEGCIGPVKCGSGKPYTLPVGSHPPLGSGIQTAKLQANSMYGNCLNSSSILIKACPKPDGDPSANGFYIYKFLGLFTFEVYCTDPTKTPQTALFELAPTNAPNTTTTIQTPPATTRATTAELTTQETSTETRGTTHFETSTIEHSTSVSSTAATSPSEPSTSEHSTEDILTTESSTVEISTHEPSSTVHSTPMISTPQPSTFETSTLEPSTTEHSTEDILTTESSTVAISTHEPSSTEHSTPMDSTPQPSTFETSTLELSTTEHSTEDILTTESSTVEISTHEPSSTEHTTLMDSTPLPSTSETSTSTLEHSTNEISTTKYSPPGPLTSVPATFEPSTTKPVQSTTPVVLKPTVTIIQTETENKVNTTTETRNANNITATIITTEETTTTKTFVTVKTDEITRKTTVISSSCMATIITIDTSVNVETRNTTDHAHVADDKSSFNEGILQIPSRPFIQEPVSTITTTATTTAALDSGTRTTTITTTITKQTTTQVAYA